MFVPAFPESEQALAEYLAKPASSYFAIFVEDQPTGIIGAENIDQTVSKLEMRKLVGNTAMRGKGIGKRATFLFLYYVFEILQFHKVYLHSTDINIRNLNLNNKFGFELEGVFPEEALVGGQMVDVVRMGLRATVWKELFAPRGRAGGRRAATG
jgi:RimJ/RimL family protein N-acetyltransferase